MFCNKCGQQLKEGAMFCTNCGNKVSTGVPTLGIPPVEATKPNEPTASSSTQQPTQPAAQPERVAQPTPQQPMYQQQEKPAQFVQHVSSGEAEKYIDMLVGVLGFMPAAPLLIQLVLRIVFGILFAVLSGILYSVGGGFIGGFFQELAFALNSSGLITLLWWIILICAIVAIGGLIYTIMNRSGQDNTLRIIGIGMAASALVAAIGGITRVGALSFIFGLIAIVLGIEFFMKMYINHEGLDSKFELGQDITQLIDSIKAKNAVKKEQYTNPDIARYAYTEGIEAEESFFDGDGFELFVKNLLLSLLSFVTCGIGAPWMLVNILKWEKDHTVIQGKRQTFNGTAMELFGLWIKWFLLTLVTCGVYAPFATVDYRKWVNSHTGYVGLSKAEGKYADSRFEGNGFEYYGYEGLTSLISMVTCGFATPWMVGIFKKWEAKNTIIRNEKYFYDGDGGELFPIWIVNVLLTFVTCGIFSAWATVRMNRYIIAHTHVDATYVPDSYTEV